ALVLQFRVVNDFFKQSGRTDATYEVSVIRDRNLVDAFPVEDQDRFADYCIPGYSEQIVLTAARRDNITSRAKASGFKEAMVFHPLIVVYFGKVSCTVIGEEDDHKIVFLQMFACILECTVHCGAA